MEEHGVCVIKGVLSADEVEKGISMYWDKIEGLTKEGATKEAIKRDDIHTWKNYNWPSATSGFTTNWGISQGECAWFIRTRPAVKQVFANIWKTDELLSSMDNFIVYRPWWF